MRLITRTLTTLAAATVFGGGCASTKITSMLAPGVSVRHAVVVVSVEHGNLEMRRMGEQAFVKELQLVGVRGIPWTTLMFPGRAYAGSEINRIIGDSGATAVLRVSAQGADSGVVYGPPTTTTQMTPTYGGGYSATSTTSPGIAVSWATASYEARLFDAGTSAVLWFAQMASEGTYVEEPSLIRNMVKTTVAQLRKDGVF